MKGQVVSIVQVIQLLPNCPLDAISPLGLVGCTCLRYPVHRQKKHNQRQQASLPYSSSYLRGISELLPMDHPGGHHF